MHARYDARREPYPCRARWQKACISVHTHIWEKHILKQKRTTLLRSSSFKEDVRQIRVSLQYWQALHKSIAFNHRWTLKIPASDLIMQSCTTAKKPPNIDRRPPPTMWHRHLKNLTNSKPNYHSQQPLASDEKQAFPPTMQRNRNSGIKNFPQRKNG